MAKWGSTCNHNYLYRWLPCQYFILLMMGAWRPKQVEEGNDSFVPNMVKWWSTCNHNYLYRWLPCQYFILLMMGAWRPKQVEEVCSNKICILLHHVGVLFNLRSRILCLLLPKKRKHWDGKDKKISVCVGVSASSLQPFGHFEATWYECYNIGGYLKVVIFFNFLQSV